MGAEWLHIIDLDGARKGKPENLRVVSEQKKNGYKDTIWWRHKK